MAPLSLHRIDSLFLKGIRLYPHPPPDLTAPLRVPCFTMQNERVSILNVNSHYARGAGIGPPQAGISPPRHPCEFTYQNDRVFVLNVNSHIETTLGAINLPKLASKNEAPLTLRAPWIVDRPRAL